MSELKAFDVGLGRYTEDGYPCIVAFDADGNPRLLGDEKVYLKSEADKVIAELEESHKKEVEQLLILNREQNNAANRFRDSMEQVIRHSKYKRCLAMADFCLSQHDYYEAVGNGFWLVRGDTEARDAYREKADGFWGKWHKRWLELAEKFKEAK